MRMDPTDISDVTGSTYMYQMNGHGPHDNWTGLFKPGERVRLRFVNASAMPNFNVRLPGLPMTVVQADGQNVRPVETAEFPIAVRSEARRVGKECVRTCRFRVSPYTYKKNNTRNNTIA